MNDVLASSVKLIQNEIKDPQFKISLNTQWSSEAANYRIKIREHLSTVESSLFTREQAIQLYDLNQRPAAFQGFISISHCKNIGGFSYSTLAHGFDVEEIKRIADPIIIRTSSEQERLEAPHIKLLWVAKEAAYKALSETDGLLITDLVCTGWKSISDVGIWSYKITSQKTVRTQLNRGYVFSTPTLFLAVYFK